LFNPHYALEKKVLILVDKILMRSVRKNEYMNFELSFTNKEITPWGGMVFLKQMLDKIRFMEHIQSCQSLPTQDSNRAHKIETLIESFITSIWCGANRFLHT
jgi:hypothetical protein